MCDELTSVKRIRDSITTDYAEWDGYPDLEETLLKDLRDMLDAYDQERQRLATIRELFTTVVESGYRYHVVKPLAEALGVPLINRQQVAEWTESKRRALEQGDGD